MRHRMAGRKLGRKTQHRKAMWRNMAVSLFTHGQITTTLPKAKSVQPFVEKIITAARPGNLAARRRVQRMLGQDFIMVRHEDDENVERNKYGEVATEGGRKLAPRIVKHIVDEIAPRYADRDGGYTRIIKLAKHRIGDGADLCVLQLVGEEEGGPQVGGQYSRRRDKANRRMEFAAKLRKGGAAAAAAEEEVPAEATAETVEGSRAEEGTPSDEHQASQEEAEPREGDTAEGDERES
ncbi:MAG: 50S ribosomal protein L17 [Phycisphaeraceae bacterium]